MYYRIEDLYFKFAVWICTLLVVGLAGSGIVSGLGIWIDISVSALLGWCGLAVISHTISWLCMKLFKRHWRRVSMLIAVLTVYYVTLDHLYLGNSSLVLGFTLLLAFIAIGTGCAMDLAVRKGPGSPQGVVSSVLLLFGWSYLIFVIVMPGWDQLPRLAIHPELDRDCYVLDAEDPAKPGTFTFQYFTYGSGNDKHRAEFGHKVDIASPSVDGSTWVSGWGKARTWFWGFDSTKLPLNGRLWLPESEAAVPLVFIVHGNHASEDFSDEGYGYLGRLLASKGYAVVSIDENFLNSSWSGSLEDDMAGRYQLIIEHLKLLDRWSQQPNHKLFGKIDVSRTILIGHSRGGEAIVRAAAMLQDHPIKESNINIKGLAAIAPTDMEFSKGLDPAGIHYFVMHGSFDGDVSAFKGQRQYDRINLPRGSEAFKSSLYIQGANHGQFNTTWGKWDVALSAGLLLNREGMLEADDQRRIAEVYISAFVDAVVDKQSKYIPLFQNYLYALPWLPETVYVNQYLDSDVLIFEDFDHVQEVDQLDTMKGKHLKEMDVIEVYLRDEYSMYNDALKLAWDQAKASIRYEFHSPLDVSQYAGRPSAALFMSISDQSASICKAVQTGECLDFSVILEDVEGKEAVFSASQVLPAAPALHTKFTKFNVLDRYFKNGRYEQSADTVFQTYRIPIKWIAGDESGIDLSQLKAIRMDWNPQLKGQVLVDQIGLDR